MKKFTFIASLLLACSAITASAQTCVVKKFASQSDKITSVDQISDGGLYAFYSPSKKKYIKLSESNYQLNNDATLSNDDATDAFSVFKIHVITEGESQKYSFETAHANVYMKPVVDGDCYAEYTTTPATFEIRTTNVDGAAPSSNAAFCIKNSGDNKWFDMQDGKFVGWNGNGSNCGYDIIPVTVSDVDPTTYCYATHKMQLSDGTEITGYAAPFEAKYYADGTEMPETSPASCNYTVTLTNTSNVLASGNTEFVYEATKTGEAPVTFSTADSKTWYKVMIKDGNRILKSIEEGNTLHIRTTNFTLNEAGLVDFDGFNSIVWSFVESGVGVKLYNKGTGKYVKWVSGCAELVNEANASTFYFVENTNATNGFGLWTGASSGDRYLNAAASFNNSGANTRLGAWSANGGGSCFLVEAIDENADLVAVGGALLKTAISSTTPNTANETYVTAGLQGDIDKAATAATSATTVGGLDAVLASLNVPAADINPNAVYRIRNVNSATKKYASTNQMVVGTDGTLAAAYNQNTGMDRTVRRTTSNDDFMSQLWYLEANADGTYKIKSANVGAYWCNSAVNDIDMPISKDFSGDFKFQGMPNISFSGNNPPANDATTMFLLSIGGKHVNAFQGDDNNVIKNWQQENDPGNYWQIEKVTSIPVTIGETGYASVGYPFAVQVPEESGVEAYYGSKAENGVLTLVKIEDGIIPANTGAILYKEGGATLNLAITTTAKTITDHVLVAANAKRIGFSAGENYLLAKDADNTVKFLLSEITTVPANKAFLRANSVVSSSSALAFSFDSETTGISNVQTVKTAGAIYDLSGRRVKNAQKGVFIINGKKVIK